MKLLTQSLLYKTCDSLRNIFMPRDIPFWEACAPCAYVFKANTQGHSLSSQAQVPELLKKFSEFYGTRSFTTSFTKTRQLSILSHINPVHVLPNSYFQNMLILSPIYAQVFQVFSFLHVFHQNLYTFPSCSQQKCILFSFPPYVPHVLPITLFFI